MNEKRIKELEKAILDANSWLVSGEGVGLTYYFNTYENTEDSKKVIEKLLGESDGK